MIKKLDENAQHSVQDMNKRLELILGNYKEMFNISYRAMAEDMGVNAETIYRLANGSHAKHSRIGIRSDTLTIICQYFNISADWVLFGIEEEERYTK